MTALLVALVFGQTAKEAPKAETRLVLDRRFVPAIGEACHILSGNGKPVIAATDRQALDRLLKAAQARDKVGVEEMVGRGEAIILDDGTAALIIEAGSGFITSRAVATEAGGRGSRVRVAETTVLSWKVRIGAGEYKDKIAYVPVVNLGRLIEVAPPKAKVKPKPKEASPALLAEREAGVAYRVAKSREATKPAEAIATYQRILKDFPSTDAAKLATARLKVLQP